MSGEIVVGDKVKIGDRVGEVIKIEEHGDAFQFRVAFSEGSPESFFSPPTEVEKVSGPLENLRSLDFDPVYKFDLLTRATQLSLAFEYDQLLSLSNSRINMEPYQVECVNQVVNSMKQRFLLADDVGLGKTIEAGMILKELEARGRADRVLIVPPASLVDQWKREMKEKFDVNFWAYDSSKVEEIEDNISRQSNPWNYKNKVITSIDYAKQDHVRPSLSKAGDWDLIIFDEAHKLSKTRDRETQRFKLGVDLADKTDSLLLLTATPHNGNDFRFYHLVRLLDRYKFRDPDSLNSEKLDDIMVRRGKKRLKDENGKPVFKNRHVKTIPVEFTDEEMKLYKEVTEYVRNEYNMAKKEKKRAVGFAMVILQKRMVSSIAAIRASLRRRLSHIRLDRDGEDFEEVSEEEKSLYEDYLEDPDSLSDYQKEVLERKLEKVSGAETSRGREIETEKLEELIDLAEDVEHDSKAEELRNFVDGIFEENPDERLLIFTEYKDTLDYLKDTVLEKYSQNGDITEIHGDVEMELRKDREDLFRKGDKKIMIATDAAGEGINLQFCHIMVNYELPWNPNRIDQRIGRLHRYGQEKDVKVHNLLIENTREGQILMRLQEKIKTIESSLGGEVPDVLGQVLSNVELEDLIMESLSEGESIEATDESIEEAIEERRKMLEEAQDLLMDLKEFDLEDALEALEKSEEIAFSNQDIEEFVRAFFERHDGKIENTRYKKQYRIYPPMEVQEENKVPEKIERATFDKDIAKKYDPDECEFIAFGHPMLENIIDYCTARDAHFGGSSAVKSLESTGLEGLLFNYHVTYIDASGEKISEKILPILVNEKECKELDREDLEEILFVEDDLESVDLKERTKRLAKQSDNLESRARKTAEKISEKKLADVKETRENRIEVKMGEAEKYFKPKIKQEKKRIKSFKKRKKKGEKMDIAIRNAKRKKEDLEKEFEERKKHLRSRKKIYVEAPKLLNCSLLI